MKESEIKKRKPTYGPQASELIASIESPGARIFVSTIRAIAVTSIEVGIPGASFGVGVTFLAKLVFGGGPSDPYKIITACVLTLVGILTHLWIYAREHPKKQSDHVITQLGRMTAMVEKALETRIDGDAEQQN